MEELPFPFEVREVIYKKLDEKSIQTLRLVNSAFKQEIDTCVGLKFMIDLNEISVDMFERLSQIRARSLKFFHKATNSTSFIISNDKNDYPWLGWNFKSKFPMAVKSLEIGDKKYTLTYIDQKFLLSLLKEFQNLKILRLIGPYFITGGAPELIESVEGINILTKLETLEISCHDTTGEMLLFDLLTHLNSHVLKSISVSLASCNLYMRPDSEMYLQRALWPAFFKFISRHWESVRDLAFNVDWFGEQDFQIEKEDWSWIESQKGASNLKKIQGLTKLSFGISKDAILGIRGPNQVTKILTDLIQQQRQLEIFEMNGGEILTQSLLSHVLEFNFNSLKTISIGNLGLDEPEFIRGILDIDIFTPCHHLKKLELRTDSFIANPTVEDARPFKLRNLDRSPATLEELVIRGFWLEGDPIPQLRQLFESTPILKSFQIEIECPFTLRGLTQVIMDLIQNVVTFESIGIRIRRWTSSGMMEMDGWNEEHRRLKKLFASLGSSEYTLFYGHEGGGEQELDDYRFSSQPLFRIWEWKARGISSVDRVKILSERVSILRIEEPFYF